MEFTNAKELANTLDGREYPFDRNITEGELKRARELGLVIVYGLSDDLCEFDGAYREEYAAWEGRTHFWDGERFNSRYRGEHNLETTREIYIDQIWGPEGRSLSWGFETNIAGVEKFMIMEDGEPYGEGLVFELTALRKPQPADLRKEVTVYQLGLMLHALGIEFKDSREPTRNYFSTSKKTTDYEPWSGLVGMGLAETASETQGDDVTFFVTERGQEFCARGF